MSRREEGGGNDRNETEEPVVDRAQGGGAAKADPVEPEGVVLTIGPDSAGNLLEVIWLQLDGVDLVIHAMRLRPTFFDLLPTGDNQR